MINHECYGRIFRDEQRGAPPVRIYCSVHGECGCDVIVGLRLDNHEPAVLWFDCEAHAGQPETPSTRFFDSIVMNPEARAVEDVIVEMLA